MVCIVIASALALEHILQMWDAMFCTTVDSPLGRVSYPLALRRPALPRSYYSATDASFERSTLGNFGMLDITFHKNGESYFPPINKTSACKGTQAFYTAKLQRRLLPS